ncbi:MAG TPA: DMT family transporter [Chroococcidiopsis sp.]
MTQNQRWVLSPGILFAIAAPLLYSASIPLSKVFLKQVDPWMLAGLLDLGAALGTVLIYLGRWAIARRPAKGGLVGKDWWWLWGSVVAGGMIAPVLQAFGIAHSTAASASLLLNLEGVFTALIAWVVFREVFNRQLALGLAFITAGSMVLVLGEGSEVRMSWGALAVVGAALAWATTSNLTHKVSSNDPLQVIFWKTGISGSFNVTLALLIGNKLPPWPTLQGIAIAGFLCIGLTFICFLMALRYIGTSQTGTLFSLFPFSGAVISVVFLKEPLTPGLIGAATLMAVGLGFCLGTSNKSVLPPS